MIIKTSYTTYLRLFELFLRRGGDGGRARCCDLAYSTAATFYGHGSVWWNTALLGAEFRSYVTSGGLSPPDLTRRGLIEQLRIAQVRQVWSVKLRNCETV